MTWRAMAKVMRACKGCISSTPTRISAQQSMIAATAASHDWLSCCER
jgi:hypothetical protein